MTVHQRTPVSAWLLQMCVPLFLFGACLIAGNIVEPQRLHDDPTHLFRAFPLFMGGYGVMLVAGVLFGGGRSLDDMLFPSLILIIPSAAFILVLAALPAIGNWWQGAFVPIAVATWTGTATAFWHLRCAVSHCGVRWRFALPVSLVAALVPIEASLHPHSLLLHGAICLYSFTIAAVALRDRARGSRFITVPS